MSKRVLFKIFPQNKLIIQYYEGDIYLQDIIGLKEKLLSDKYYVEDCNVIVDFRLANLHLKDADVDSYISFLNKSRSRFNQSNGGILTSEPNEVVLSTLFIDGVKHLPAEWGVFSTVSAVLKWTNQQSFTEEEFENVINALCLV